MSEIEVTTPQANSTVSVRSPVRVGGTATGDSREVKGEFVEHPPLGVTVEVDGGPAQSATGLDAGWESWEASVVVPAVGTHKITARVHTSLTDAADTVTVTAVDPAGPVLGVVSPAGAVATRAFQLVAAASHANGVTAVRAALAGGPAVPLQAVPSSPLWQATLTLPSRTAPTSYPLTLSGSSGSGSSSTMTVQVAVADSTRPTLSFTPGDRSKVPGTRDGADVPVVILTRDGGDDVVTSGVTSAEVQVDGGAWQAATKVADGEPSQWTATVRLPAADAHQLTVRCTDAVGNVSVPVTHVVVVTVPNTVRDLSRASYLADLLEFATRRVLTREGGPHVNPAQVAEAFGQPFVEIARADQAAAGRQQPALRLVTDTLRHYLAPGAPAAAAAWPLAEGSGTLASDASGGGADGTIVDGAWSTGAGTPALAFNGTSTTVKVAARPQLTLTTAATIAARIHPTGPGDSANGGILVNKEGEYEVARFPDGTIRWAFANADPGWDWRSTGAVAPQDTSTHVAITYGDGQVRTYLDGVLRHTEAVTGPIGDVDPAHSDLWIGGRPVIAQFFAGQIADVVLVDRVLTEWEILRLAGVVPPAAEVWVDDDTPADAQLSGDQDAWEWVEADPAPASGTRCHRSALAAGTHQHFFTSAGVRWPVDPGDRLVTAVWLDPTNPPKEIMLQWLDTQGSWDHRAYWGENRIHWGVDGSTSRQRLGPLPEAGRWARLEVPAGLVGMERQTVHGLAFTAFDGRAAWDGSGRQSWLTTLSGAHTSAAYAALLAALGTSEEELRLARGNSARQAALADRLGIALTAPGPAGNELDQLLLDDTELTDDALEALFGLASPLRALPASGAAGTPLLAQWQSIRLRQLWRAQDLSAGGDAGPPVIDPDVVLASDIVDPAGAAAQIRKDRAEWLAHQAGTLAAVRAGAPDDRAAVTAVIAQVLGGLDLDQLAEDRRQGRDIRAALEAARLTLADFVRLSDLRGLAAADTLRPREWAELVDLLVRVLKLRNHSRWRAEERSADLLLDPAIFVAAPSVGAQGSVDRAARRDWLDRLRGRQVQLDSIRSGLADAVADAERAGLPLFRDALLAALDPEGTPGIANTVSARLLIDMQAGPALTSSRADQAIETLQAVLFAARTNRLDTAFPGLPPSPAASWVLEKTPAYTIADFDEEWQWMSTYAGWQAAVSVFFHPEMLLTPALRPQPTKAFGNLLAKLTDAGRDLSPFLARRIAHDYAGELPDDAKAALIPLDGLALDDRLSDAQLAKYAQAQPAVFAAVSATAMADAPTWLLEATYLVPLQIGLSLQRAGQYLAALDWLRTVYAYDQGPDARVVFHGFRLDAAGQPVLSRPVRWLLDEELNPHRLAVGRPNLHLASTLSAVARCLVDFADAEYTQDTPESRPGARALYLSALAVLDTAETAVPAPTDGTLPANPIPHMLRDHAEVNLTKLRRGLNIAGLPRPAVEPPPSDAAGVAVAAGGTGLAPPRPQLVPTAYRYSTLIARAQSLLAAAGQVEVAYLAALERAGGEGYTEQQARQDLELTGAQAQIQQSAALLAQGEVDLAEAGRARALTQSLTLGEWITAGPTQWEQDLLDSYEQAREAQRWIAFADAAITMFSAAASASPTGGPAAFAVGAAAAGRMLAVSAANDAELRAQRASFFATHERRVQEWSLQKALADHDVQIANRQIAQAAGRAEIAQKESEIAATRQRYAQTNVDYLATRLLNAEMYQWMSGALGEVYRYLLQQATSVALLAERQLAFERQEAPPPTIQADYWTPPPPADGGDQQPERAGLTGSARLLRDLTQLDQFAFDTNRRKLQLAQTFSLAQLAPAEFQRFRQTGVLPFATSMEAFDRCFPGHYLRTIRRVRVTVIALVSTTAGIRASLTCGGVSRVVIGGDTFRTVTIARAPEVVALTSLVNATGVFELDLQPELLLPFEGHGVDTLWEFRLPRPANPFDFKTVMDVLVTIEYTALHSGDYARKVIGRLPTEASNTLALSLRDNYPDSWYELTGAPEATAVRTVGLPVGRADFPANLENIRLTSLALLVVRAEDQADAMQPPQLAIDHLHLVRGRARITGGPATAVANIISTRRPNGLNWQPLLSPPATVQADGTSPAWDPAPFGLWELALANQPAVREALQSGAVQDLVLLLGYSANLPPWPT
jgi:hypothetical protein